MAVTTVSNSPNESLLASLTSRSTANGSAIDEAENRFLKLLTTQLQNQDPLNPLDNAQMTSQLAQISTVNGIEKLNTTLQSLLSDSTQSQTIQAAALVNHGVLVPGSRMALGVDGAIGGIELSTGSDETVVTIKDNNGLVMRTINLGALGAGIHPFAWDGMTDSGQRAVDGSYSFSVSGKQGGKQTSASSLAFGLVQSVSRNNGDLMLDIGALGSFGVSDVKKIL